MRLRNYVVVSLLINLCCISVHAEDTLRLTRQQCEGIFLKENLQLLAEKLEIPMAEAMVLQAGLWPNPVVAVEDVNLWATQKQISVFGEEIPGFGGSNFGRNLQFAFSVEQLIETAGKRKKRIALQETGVQKSVQNFEELLRSLKTEFRHRLTTLQFQQASQKIYLRQILSVQQLTLALQKQLDRGFISKGEFVRLKALEMELKKNANELEREMNETQTELKLFMKLPAEKWLVITDLFKLAEPNLLQPPLLSTLLDSAKAIRPDIKLANLQQTYFHNLYNYEKAQRTPNLTIKGAYDRASNFMYNFVGFGVAMDLPVFNKNLGNIKQARIAIDQSKLFYEQKVLTVENEIALAYQNLLSSIRFYKTIEPGYEQTLEELLEAYTKNFTARNLSLLEYLDFIDAYLENKKIILEAEKNIMEKTEELNFSVGREIIKS